MEPRKTSTADKRRKAGPDRGRDEDSPKPIVCSTRQTLPTQHSGRPGHDQPEVLVRSGSREMNVSAQGMVICPAGSTLYVHVAPLVNDSALGDSDGGSPKLATWSDESDSPTTHGEHLFEGIRALGVDYVARLCPPYYADFASSGQYSYPQTLELDADADAKAVESAATYQAAIARGMDPRHAFPQGRSWEEWNALAVRSYR